MFVKCAGPRFAKLALGLLALLVVGVKTQAQPAPDYAALLATPDRSDETRC